MKCWQCENLRLHFFAEEFVRLTDSGQTDWVALAQAKHRFFMP